MAWHPSQPLLATGNQARARARQSVWMAQAAPWQRVQLVVQLPDESAYRSTPAQSCMCVRGKVLCSALDSRRAAPPPQDTTTRVWDLRMLGKGSLALLRGSMGAVRSLRFSPDGRFLAAAESVDFVQLYEVAEDFARRAHCLHARLVDMAVTRAMQAFDAALRGRCRCQEIDLFGEVGGMAFTPGSEALFVALSEVEHSDVPYSSLLNFRRAKEASPAHQGEAGMAR